MNTLIKTHELQHLLETDPNSVVVIDVRYVLTEPEKGRELYHAAHIPGAIYLSLGKDLSSTGGEHGGRHPIPETETISKLLGELGIDQDTTVIAYDQKNGSFASRLWWQLDYLGHNKTHILEGGFEAWQEAGLPTSTENPTTEPSSFVPNLKQGQRLTRDEVLQRIGREDSVIIDARAPKRYSGATEPLDAKGGHIPGAINYFWEDLLDDSGNWKKGEALAEHFHGLPRDKELIVYCGSGVTACPNVLALKEAGFEDVKLYSGSWSDWVSYEDSPIEVGEQK
ncbi:sulfurtransferase [Alkalicoccobacillus murimartini]|uniref:Thiosulfate/3-mercaptopyruvate sulfurtransferase n=1 Tax=Alkalicoccobacillus murimartini TaxID=171685 RepID=A0ABT9YJJ2_9BACI|nr:sulfurtransferase [Alkalicoccobacillus murimartini]MDQ0207778.1 thiosulfate/3-mercaptopyruvate sulfurtransferase [Alkalicoccobacillus murimartini]